MNISVTFLGTASGGGPSESRNCSSLICEISNDGTLWSAHIDLTYNASFNYICSSDSGRLRGRYNSPVPIPSTGSEAAYSRLEDLYYPFAWYVSPVALTAPMLIMWQLIILWVLLRSSGMSYILQKQAVHPHPPRWIGLYVVLLHQCIFIELLH